MLLSRQSYSFQRTAGQLVALESALVLVLLILLVFSQSWLETPFRFASLALPLLQLPPCHPIGLQLRQGYFFVRKLMLQSVLPQTAAPSLACFGHFGLDIVYIDGASCKIRKLSLVQRRLPLGLLVSSASYSYFFRHGVGNSLKTMLVPGLGLVSETTVIANGSFGGIEPHISIVIVGLPRALATFLASHYIHGAHPAIFIEELGHSALLEVESVGIERMMLGRSSSLFHFRRTGFQGGLVLTMVLECRGIFMLIQVAMLTHKCMAPLEMFGAFLAYPKSLTGEGAQTYFSWTRLPHGHKFEDAGVLLHWQLLIKLRDTSQ